MSDQPIRQPFRFHIPWVMNPLPSRPLPPLPPPTQTQPAQTTTTERPPFRPAGVAPPRHSPQPPSPSRTAPQPPAPKISSEPQAQPKVESKPPSPPQATPKSQVVSQPRSSSQTVPSQPQSPPSPRTKPQPVKTETLDVSSSPSRTTSQPKPATQKTSQPPSPSRTSQPQPATQRTSQPSSPTLTATKTERTSQPPSSPIRPASQPATKTVSQPSSPSRIGQETKTHKASPPQSPSIQDPRSQPTTQVPFKPTSPPKSFASRTERPAEKLLQFIQPENYKPEPQYQPGEATFSAPGSQPDETKIKPQEKPMIETDVEPKQMASGSNLVTRGLLGTKPDEEKPPLKKHTPTDEKEIPAMASKENVRRTTVPISQEGRKERHEDFPKPSMPHGERAALHKDIRDDITKFVQKLSTEHPNQSNDEHPASVITLAGENRGATMHLDSNAERKEGAIRIHRGYKLNQDKEATTDGETSSKAERSNDPVTTEDSTSMVYINSNTQSVNNSLVFNSSIDEGSPGVHLVFSQNHREPPKSSGKPEPLPARKADFNTTQSQKLTYDPTIRRRCLRGLMLEPSDSDPENPDKPRRHGCRYSCEDKKKAEDNGNEG